MNRFRHLRYIVVILLCIALKCQAQVIGPRVLNMEQAVQLAQENSISAMTGRNAFAAQYWSYRSYRAELLPSLNLSDDAPIQITE